MKIELVQIHQMNATCCWFLWKIVDGTQGLGKVLTSDANGKSSWQTPTLTNHADIYLEVQQCNH
jgi:hypothetical protein